MEAFHLILMMGASFLLVVAALFHPANMTGTPTHSPRFSMRFGWAGMALWALHITLSMVEAILRHR